MATFPQIYQNNLAQQQWIRNYQYGAFIDACNRAEKERKEKYAKMTPEERAEESKKVYLLKKQMQKEGERCEKECSPYVRPFCLSKCELVFGLLGGGMLFGGGVVSVVASIAVAYPGAVLLIGMFVKRVFIASYFCISGCPTDNDPACVGNGWAEWCLCGRTSATFCNDSQV